MEIRLDGKIAFISGSTSGIGLAIAKGLASAGADIYINGRTIEHIEIAIQKIKESIPEARVSGIVADLSKREGTNQIIESLSHVDILVNNLGIFEPKAFLDITDEDWEEYIQVNLMSSVRLSRHFIPGMVNNAWGRILFNGSAYSGFFSGEMVHYGATKAAVLGLSRGLAEGVADSGITVNAFIPGPTRTEKVEEHFSGTGEAFKETEKTIFRTMLQTSILKRFISPEEVANLVVFLASEQADAVTGSTFKVDGGIYRTLL